MIAFIRRDTLCSIFTARSAEKIKLNVPLSLWDAKDNFVFAIRASDCNASAGFTRDKKEMPEVRFGKKGDLIYELSFEDTSLSKFISFLVNEMILFIYYTYIL